MTMFWFVAALFLAGALLMLLPDLWRARAAVSTPVPAPAATARGLRPTGADGLVDVAELAPPPPAPAVVVRSRRPSPRATGLVLALLLPLASVLTYLQVGTPEAIAPQTTAGERDRHALTPDLLQQRAAALAERLRVSPGDAEGWMTLARSYTVLGRFRDAAAAMRKAVDLLPPNPTLLADLADLVAMGQGRRLGGEPARLIQRALDLDPRHAKALALAGTAAFELRDYSASRGYWERLLAVLPADSPMRRSAQGSLAEAARLEAAADPGAAGMRPVASTEPAAAAPTRVQAKAQAQAPATAAGRVSGEVSVAPELAARLAPGDTLFVFARAVDGPRMPLAIVRLGATAARQSFTLDDSMAMAPGMKLSAFERVTIGARVSRSGSATPQPGDLVGQSAPVAPGTEGLRIVVDRVQP